MEDTEFDGRIECAQSLIPKKRPGCYAGVENCCKICRRHHPSGPTAVISETHYRCYRRSFRGPDVNVQVRDVQLPFSSIRLHPSPLGKLTSQH